MKLRGFESVKEENRKSILLKCNQMEASAKELGVELLTKPDTFIDDDHLDCVWYGGYIGGLKYKGYELSLEVHGEVVICGVVNGEDFEYVNRLNTGAMNMAASDHLRTAFKSDAELNEAIQNESIELTANNWIEAFVQDPSGYWSEGVVVDETDNVLDACSDVSGWVSWLKENFIQNEEQKATPLDQQISSAEKRTEPQPDKTASTPEKGR